VVGVYCPDEMKRAPSSSPGFLQLRTRDVMEKRRQRAWSVGTTWTPGDLDNARLGVLHLFLGETQQIRICRSGIGEAKLRWAGGWEMCAAVEHGSRELRQGV
jgi:hypothetical protein